MPQEPGMTSRHIKVVQAPLSRELLRELQAGDCLSLSGSVHLVDRAEHRRLAESTRQGDLRELDLAGQVLCYVQKATDSRPCLVESAGFDSESPWLFSLGFRATLGLGRRSAAVRYALRKYRAVHLVPVPQPGAEASPCRLECRHLPPSPQPADRCGLSVIRIGNLLVMVAHDAHGYEWL